MNEMKDYTWELVSSNENRNFYYCTSKDGQVYVVSVPINVNPSTQVAFYIPGTGGGNRSDKNNHNSIGYYLEGFDESSNVIFIGYKESQNYGNEINLVTNEYLNSTYADFNSEILNEVIDECNLNPKQVTTFLGWSNGAGISLQMGIDFLKAEKATGEMTPRVFAMINSAGFVGEVVSDEDIALLAESHSTLFVMTENGEQPAMKKYIEWAKTYGIPLVRINIGAKDNVSTVHNTENAAAGRKGIVNFLTGTGNYDSTYFERYDPKTGGWVKMSSSEVLEYLGVVSTNYNSLEEYVNSILQALSSSSFDNINIESTTNVPSICIEAFNSLISSSNTLIDKIKGELNTLLQVKDSIEQMERQLYEEAQFLNMDINSHEFEMNNIDESYEADKDE